MPPIRVLVVDDSVVVRRIVTDVLARDPAIEVVGTAANGVLALAKLPQLHPDLVVLDLEMPEMDGLATLTAIRQTHPRLPVIIFSSLTERGAVATLDAFGRGASDYVTKPANAGSGAEAQQRIEEQLVPRIKALAGRPVTVPRRATTPVVAPVAAGMVEVLAIGVSTGGPNALAALLAALPATFPLPIVVVQHMPPVFTRFLATRLDTVTPLSVREGVAGGVVEAGTVWIAPGDHHMVLRREAGQVRLVLNQDAPENSCRPAVDPLFRSVAGVYGARALGLVLTGMGYDGLAGARVLGGAGAPVLVQDQASSVVWGMPGAIAEAGLAAAVLPLDAMPAELTRRAWVGRSPKVKQLLTQVVPS